MLKALANRLKETLLDLIKRQQTAYVKNRFIGEGGSVISDILESDTEKVFDSSSHSYSLSCL